MIHSTEMSSRFCVRGRKGLEVFNLPPLPPATLDVKTQHTFMVSVQSAVLQSAYYSDLNNVFITSVRFAWALTCNAVGWLFVLHIRLYAWLM